MARSPPPDTNIVEDTALVFLLFGVCSSPALLTEWWPMPVAFWVIAGVCFVLGFGVRRSL